jgi:propanol-preferring alcohol dehydrogenase
MAKTTMSAVVRAFDKPLTIEEVPVPTQAPGPDQVQVAVSASGVCHQPPRPTPNW